MNPTPQEILKKLQSIEEILNSLKSSNAIPRDIETALRGRLGDITLKTESAATTAIGGAAAFNLPNVTGVIHMKLPDGRIIKLLYQ